MNKPTDYEHLLRNAALLFPNSEVDVIHAIDEIIHLVVDGHRYTFEIGSDDDEYVFTDGKMTFTIPLMDFDEDF